MTTFECQLNLPLTISPLTCGDIHLSQLVWHFRSLQGQCKEIFDTFFAQNSLSGLDMKMLKRFREMFRFREDYNYKVRKSCKRVINDYTYGAQVKVLIQKKC